jgi:hypothetical protein
MTPLNSLSRWRERAGVRALRHAWHRRLHMTAAPSPQPSPAQRERESNVPG